MKLAMDEMLRGLLALSPDAILVLDADERIVLANPAAAALTGYDLAALQGAALSALIPDADRPRHAEHVRRFFEQPETRPMGAASGLSLRRADGYELAVEISLKPVATPRGLLVAAAIRDVAHARELEAHLAAAERLAALGLIAAGVAHEINNPMVAVLGNLELLFDDGPAVVGGIPGAWASLVDARDGALRVRDIIRDLLVFARPDDEADAMIDVVAVIESALRLASNELRRHATLVTELRPVPPIAGCGGRLSQVVLNLVVNAAQAIPVERSDGQVRVACAVDPDGQVVIEVTDNGCGMSPTAQQRLFVPFVSTKPQGAGVGLGLSICKRIVTQLRGRIAVDSAVGQGTTFRLTFPPAARRA